MIPIIFLAGSTRLRSSADALLSGFTFSRHTHNSMGTFNRLSDVRPIVLDSNNRRNNLRKKLKFKCKKFLLYEESKIAGRPGREIQTTGRGGAPKFLKNWLPFACSPYDPDHISCRIDPSAVLRGRSTQWFHFLSPHS